MQTKQQALRLGLALSALIAASAAVSADEYVDKAKAYIDQITKPGARLDRTDERPEGARA